MSDLGIQSPGISESLAQFKDQRRGTSRVLLCWGGHECCFPPYHKQPPKGVVRPRNHRRSAEQQRRPSLMMILSPVFIIFHRDVTPRIWSPLRTGNDSRDAFLVEGPMDMDCHVFCLSPFWNLEGHNTLMNKSLHILLPFLNPDLSPLWNALLTQKE